MNLAELNRFLTSCCANIELTWRLFCDLRVPLLTKIIFITVLSLYLISPIDLIPDFLPVLGQVDDVALSFFLMLQFIKSCPEEIVNLHKQSIVNGDWKLGIFKFLTGSHK
jgi:uncharacterized membrane protein YkvA (DUF1232 family)